MASSTITVVYSNRFLRSAKKLPVQQKERLAALLEMLSKDPFDKRLHTKHLSGQLSGLYSFRVGRDYRALFQFLSPTEVQVVDVAHRKDIYK